MIREVRKMLDRLMVSSLVLMLPLLASAQTTQPHPHTQPTHTLPNRDPVPPAAPPGSGLGRVLPEVNLDNVSAEQALNWLSREAGLTLMVDWPQLEARGIDRQTPVRLILSNVTAEKTLDLILEQISPDFDPLVWEQTAWYTRVSTKEQANLRPVVRRYPIGDLIMRVPNFDDAPRMDLSEITQGRAGRGSGSGSGSGSIFAEDDQERDDPLGRAARAEEIAQVIRNTIEPEIWEANGGTAGSISYWNGQLIIRAPLYVHGRIGGPDQSVLGGVRNPLRVPARGETGRRGGMWLNYDAAGGASVTPGAYGPPKAGIGDQPSRRPGGIDTSVLRR